MKTGGFSRFARKPGSSESARDNPVVGSNSTSCLKSYIQSHSIDKNENWGMSSFENDFGFDAGLDETHFGGEEVRPVGDMFPVPRPIDKTRLVDQGGSFCGVLSTKEVDFDRPLDGSLSSNVPKTPQTSITPIPFQERSPSLFPDCHATSAALPFITPAPVEQVGDIRDETCRVTTEDVDMPSSIKEPLHPCYSFTVDKAIGSVDPRNVTLEGTGLIKYDTFKTPSKTDFATNGKGILDSVSSDKVSSNIETLLQGASEHAIDYSAKPKNNLNDSSRRKQYNGSLSETMDEPICTGVVDSFEEMFQLIMSKNLQFEDGWKHFEERVLDLSTHLSVRESDILELEQSTMNLKQDMIQKFEVLLSQVNF